VEVRQALGTRRAVREFAAKPLPDEAVRFILDAGRRAQSAKNTQPWEFIAIRDRETLRRLSLTGTYAGHLSGAALGVAILTLDPSRRWSILFDAGQAAAQMQIAAWSIGIGSCPATIYQPEEACQILGFPPDLALNVILSFGFPADPSVLTNTLRRGGRRSFDETVHLEHW